ncbi:MAG: hypothetical protein CSA62_05935 [Planctomycetota bacterium]|nr:MAG: hypothetical protein CSA62_05935 [Planctomycetota bacterium]
MQGLSNDDREEAPGAGAGTDPTQAAVWVSGLSLSYQRSRLGGLLGRGRFEVLHDLSFDAQRGEIVGVVGPNGSGKSSLFRSLLGLEAARGDVRLLGLRPGARELRKRIGSSSDEGLPFPEFTALELLTLDGSLSGQPLHSAKAKAEAMLERVGLTDARRRRHGEFSSGMQKRLALAHALLLEPEILLLDEPTANLDPIGIRLVAEELGKFQEQGGCALVATHGLEDFPGLFSRLLVLLEGRRIAFGSPEQVLGELDRFELRLESNDRELLASLAQKASQQGITGQKLGPLQRSLGKMLAEAQERAAP